MCVKGVEACEDLEEVEVVCSRKISKKDGGRGSIYTFSNRHLEVNGLVDGVWLRERANESKSGWRLIYTTTTVCAAMIATFVLRSTRKTKACVFAR